MRHARGRFVRGRDRGGFTLLELLLTLLIIAGFAAGTVTIYFGRPDVTLENASVLLAHDLRAAQNRAAYLGRETHVHFLPNGYEVKDTAGFVVSNPRTEQPFVRDYAMDGVFQGVTVKDVWVGPRDEMVYGPNGSLLAGGEVVLAYGEDTRVVRVEAETGAITILGTTSGWVDRGY
jgi:prepilin-type N-terminal cleavage/methylation domain-containing protein